jgi:hypothetical protein
LKGLVAQDFTLVFEEDGPLGLQIDSVVQIDSIGKEQQERVIVSSLYKGAQVIIFVDTVYYC